MKLKNKKSLRRLRSNDKKKKKNNIQNKNNAIGIRVNNKLSVEIGYEPVVSFHLSPFTQLQNKPKCGLKPKFTPSQGGSSQYKIKACVSLQKSRTAAFYAFTHIILVPLSQLWYHDNNNSAQIQTLFHVDLKAIFSFW